MTRKDYVAIAAAIKARTEMARNIQNSAVRLTHYKELTGDIADVLARDNSRFDRARFLAACGTA